MSNIIKFPKEHAEPVVTTVLPVCAAKARDAGLVAGIVKFIWVVTVLVWPILKWVLSIHAAFQFVRMIYYWNTPGVYASWTFLLHFAVLTAITYFVSIYKPKGL